MRIGVIAPLDNSDEHRAASDLCNVGLCSQFLNTSTRPAVVEMPECKASITEWSDRGGWLDLVDAAIMVGRPPLPGITQALRQQGKPVLYVHAGEVLGRTAWYSEASAVWALSPSQAADMRAIDERLRIMGGRWGVDVQAIEHEPRTVAEEFALLAGDGGIIHRRGTYYFAELRGLPINVRRGDVLLSLNSWESYPYPLFTAMAQGMPVICSRHTADYWGVSPLATFRSTDSWVSLGGRKHPTVTPDMADLTGILNSLAGSDITDASYAARDQMRQCHDLREVADDMRKALELLASEES
jgi:hypothetical protein